MEINPTTEDVGQTEEETFVPASAFHGLLGQPGKPRVASAAVFRLVNQVQLNDDSSCEEEKDVVVDTAQEMLNSCKTKKGTVQEPSILVLDKLDNVLYHLEQVQNDQLKQVYATMAVIRKHDNTFCVAISCQSPKDQYDKLRGVLEAGGRAYRLAFGTNNESYDYQRTVNVPNWRGKTVHPIQYTVHVPPYIERYAGLFIVDSITADEIERMISQTYDSYPYQIVETRGNGSDDGYELEQTIEFIVEIVNQLEPTG